MRLHARLIGVGLVTVATAVPATRAAAQGAPVGERLASGQARTIAMTAGTLLRIRGVNGSVTITTGSGPEARVTATYEDGQSAPNVVLIPDGTGTTICAVHASPNPKKPNECLPSNKGRLLEGLKREWPSVRFAVVLPDGVDVSAELADGDIIANTGSGRVWLKTFRGDLVATDHGSPQFFAEVFSGSLRVAIAETASHAQRHVDLGIAGGEMRVAVPAATVRISYTISADALIHTSFKLAGGVGLRMGELGPDGPPELFLRLSTNSPLAKIVLIPLADAAAR